MPETSLVAAGLEVLRQGGFVAPWLLIGLFVLWYAMGWRWLALRRGSRKPVRTLVAEARDGRLSPSGVLPTAILLALQALEHPGSRRGVIEDAIGAVRAVLGRHRTLIQTIVILAPLAGLLGTVTGMIETFDSLAEMALFTQSGGVAGGIAEALVSTQLGLSVAVPGVILGKLLEAAEDRLHEELDEATELLVLGDDAERDEEAA